MMKTNGGTTYPRFDIKRLMVGTTGRDGYRPPLMHLLLKPRITGNEINGLGEAAFRRPRLIYHWMHKFQRVAFYWVQMFFYWRDMRVPYFRRRLEEGFENMAKPRAPVAPTPVEDTPANWARRIREFAVANESDEVGFAEIRPEWIYEGFEIKEKWIIVLGVTEEYRKIADAPAHSSNEEVLDQYNRGHRAAMKLADWLRSQGWAAECHQAFSATPIAMIPPAIAAGFGELGKHGSIINRKHGPRIRLGYVITDLPLIADAPDELHVDDFCMNCRLCTRECPPQAIFDEKQMVRGVEKWYVDFDKCLPYFNDTFGCNVCIKVCPFSRDGVSARLFDKLDKRRRSRRVAAT